MASQLFFATLGKVALPQEISSLNELKFPPLTVITSGGDPVEDTVSRGGKTQLQRPANEVFYLEPISQIGNGRVARDLALLQGARRENIRRDLRSTSNAAAAAKIGNPPGCFLAGVCDFGPSLNT